MKLNLNEIITSKEDIVPIDKFGRRHGTCVWLYPAKEKESIWWARNYSEGLLYGPEYVFNLQKELIEIRNFDKNLEDGECIQLNY